MHRLGNQADVAHHRDAAAHQPVDYGQGFRLGAFKLHSGGGGLLEHPAGGGYSVVWAALVAEEGQITNKQGHLLRAAAAGKAAGRGPGVVQHFLEGHRQRGGVAQHGHRQGIPHQHRISARLGHQSAREGIPGRKHRDRQASLLAARQISGAQGHGLRCE